MKKKSFIEKVTGIFLIAVVAIMPLIVQFAYRQLPPELIPYFPERDFPSLGSPNKRFFIDLFTYWKGLFVYFAAAVIGFCVVGDWVTSARKPDFKEFFSRPPIFISLVYLVSVLISAIASEYTFTAWFGTYARGEGAFMWLAYFVVFFSAMYFVRDTSNAKMLLFGLAFSSIIMGLIGVSQFRFLGQGWFHWTGRDFFTTDFSKWLITLTVPQMSELVEINGEMLPQRTMINPRFDMAHGTLFNPNTYGKYTAMISPVLLLAGITYKGKKYVNAIFLFAGVLMLLGIAASDSLGGYVGIAVAVGVLILTLVCRSGKLSKIIALSVGGVSAVLVVFMIMSAAFFEVTIFDRMAQAIRAETTSINDYIFEGNTMTVVGEDGDIFSVEVAGLGIVDWVTVRDAHGNVIPPLSRTVFPPEEARPVEYLFDIPGYRVIRMEKYADMFLYHHLSVFPFILTYDDGVIYGTAPGGQRIDLQRDIPAWGFKGRETWGSSRGYIWSRSLPLMFTPRALTVGSGPDTFINEFPKYEISALQRFFDSPYVIVDKAHNIVIQTWISTGAISAIALVALFGLYLYTTFFSLIKSKDEHIFSFGIRLGLLCGVCAYFMSSMATDTTIGSTGVFFVLFGAGFGMNYLRRAE
ncbi:MAG: O-antigen ligase family protein [Defluviitaleaceae bacterium]|nr:O-antigen ligase family protein [Defluviitaleaceae bacterium]